MGRRGFAAVVACCGLLPASGGAQQERLTDPAEYGRWEGLGAHVLSPRGDWVAYEVRRVDESRELRLWGEELDSTLVYPRGYGPSFSADGRWLAWTRGLPPEEEERLEEQEEEPREAVAVLDLRAPDEPRIFEATADFAFDRGGRFLALRGYPPSEPEGRGSDLRVLDLERGTEIAFGNVAEMAWSDSLSLLAMAVATGSDEGNGVQVYDASSGRVHALDASGSRYQGLSWRSSAADVAVLRSEAAAPDDGQAYEALVWRDVAVGPSQTLVLPSSPDGVADTLRIVRHHRPGWSPDGLVLSVGLRPAEAEGEEADGASELEPAGDSEDEETEADDAGGDDDDLPGVQIWHTSDVALYPEQVAREDRDAQRTLMAAWHLGEDRVVLLGSDVEAEVTLLHGWERAIEVTSVPYPWGTMFGRPYRDVWVVDAGTGERELALQRVRYAWPSASGRWLLSYDGEGYATLDLVTGQRFKITDGLPAVFADTAYDTPTDVLPPFGLGPGGWLEDDEAVFLYDRHDVWRVAPDGSEARRLTQGAEAGVTHRVVELEEDDGIAGLDPEGVRYFSLYDERTEQRGYARAVGNGRVERLVFEDAAVSTLSKADSAEVFLFRSMAHDDPPDLFAAGPDLRNPRQITRINPFFEDYAWSRAELVDFVSEAGRPLQAVLQYPPGYEPGTRVPMIVYTYEMLSPTLHRFRNPSERDYYNSTVWAQHGYAVLLPDIVYRAREPGISALESVRAAVARVVEMGVADPDRVGLIGHSWGGYQATYLPTRTDIFAASVAGAPLTDFVSFMGALHWNPGVAELSHWETGQARMEVPFWEDPEAHRRNSPVHEVHEMDTPLLMAFGNQDGVVDWDQGTEFFNFARRAGKQMVLLVYEGEDHGFRQESNQVDYHRRILEWFGHYLKGDPAPAWITEGVKLQDLEDEKRRVADKKKSG